jgi:predicted phage tail protein
LQEQFAQATLITAPGEGAPRPNNRGGGNTSTDTKKKAASLVTGVSARIEDDILNARISGNDSAIKAALQKAAGFVQRALGQKLLGRDQRESLKNDLIAFNSEISSITDSQASAAKDAAESAKRIADDAKNRQKEAAAKHKEALRKAAEASKKAAQALRDQGNALKDAALARLDAVQNNRDTLRDLADAKTGLRHARMIGGKRGILESSRNLEDARLARKRTLLEQSTIGPAGRTAAAGFVINGPIHITGVKDVKSLMAEITKASKKTATQRRGRNGGVPHGI